MKQPFTPQETIWSETLHNCEELRRMRLFCLELADRVNRGVPNAGDSWRLASLTWPMYSPKPRAKSVWELDSLTNA